MSPSDWAAIVQDLNDGRRVSVRPRGRSMEPRVLDGQLVMLEPPGIDRGLQVGDVVLVRSRGETGLHMIHAIRGERVLIGNAKGKTTGWVKVADVYGRMV